MKPTPRAATASVRVSALLARRLAAITLSALLVTSARGGAAPALTFPVQYNGGPRITATFVENHSAPGEYRWHAGIDLPRSNGADTVRASATERLHWALPVGEPQMTVQTVNNDAARIDSYWTIELTPQAGVTRYLLDILEVRRVTPGKPEVIYTIQRAREVPFGSGYTNGFVDLVPNQPSAADSLVSGDVLAVDFAYYPARLKQAVFRSPSGDEFRWYAHIDHVHRYVAWNSYPASNTNRFYGPESLIPAGRDTFEIAEGVRFAEIEQVENYASEPHHLHFSTTTGFDGLQSATNPLSQNRFGFTDPGDTRPIVRSLAFRRRVGGTFFTDNRLHGAVDIFAESRDDMGSPENEDDGDGAENTIREAGCYNAGYWVTADSAGGGTVASESAPNMMFAGSGKDSLSGTDPLSVVLLDQAPFRVDQNTNYHLWCSHVGEDVNRYWYTHARRTATQNDGAGADVARDNSEALFRDGRHVVHARARDVVGFGVARDSAVVVDNFRPYVRKLIVRDGGSEIYRAEWKQKLGNIVFSWIDPDSGTIGPEGFKRCAGGGSDVTIEVTFSEGMAQAQVASVLPLGFTPQLRREPANQDSIWHAIIPSDKLGSIEKAGRQLLSITGTDWGGNALRAIQSNANFDTPSNRRNSSGVMQGTGGTDRLHRFGICQAVAFLIDDTASMGQEIAGAKAAVLARIDDFSADRAKFPLYSIITFKDTATWHATSNDPNVIRPIVQVLGADGGADCPEASVEALQYLPGLMPRGGLAFLATDADARAGQAALNQVNAQLAAAGIKVSAIVTGNCDTPNAPGIGPGEGLVASGQGWDDAAAPGTGPVLNLDSLPTFRRIALETGGYFFYTSRDDFDEALDIALNQFDAHGLLATRVDTLAPPQVRTVLLPLDDSVRVVTFIHNPGPDSSSTLVLRRPGGAVVLPGDPDVQRTQAATVSAWRVTAPGSGTWTAEVHGSGESSFSASAETSRLVSLAAPTPILPGQPVPLTLSYTGDGVLTAARLLGANGDLLGTVPIFDDGNHDDGGVADNLYGATVTLTTPGSYRLSVDGVGSAPFTREARETLFLGEPELELEYPAITFDPTQIGESRSRTLTLRNLGTLPLEVSSIQCAHPAFEVSLAAVTLPVSGSTVLRVYFTPGQPESLSVPLTFLSDDPDAPEQTVTLTGVGLAGSELALSADSLTVEAALGDSVDVPLTIRNTGGGSLRYAILTSAPPEGSLAPWTNRSRLAPLAAGGPDAAGYRFVDSDEATGPPVHWIDLDDAGVTLTGLGDEEVRGPFPIGFEFNFYGQVETAFHVSADGFITLGTAPGTVYPSSECPGAGPAPSRMIAPTWLDLNPAAGGSVVYHGSSERLVVEYRWVAEAQSPATLHAFQTVLHPDGTIQFNYRFVPNNPASAARLSDDSGSSGLEIYCHDYVSPHGALTTEIHRDVRWLEPQTGGGTVPPGDSTTVLVRVSARQPGFLAGQEHLANLIVVTNDPEQPRVPVAVRLAVGAGTRSIAGDVTSAETFGPLSGAVVTAVGYIGTYADTADAFGHYLIPSLPGDDYVVTATALDYAASAPQSVTLPPDATLDFVLGRPTLVLTPAMVSRFVANGDVSCAPVLLRNTGTLPLTFDTRPGAVGGESAARLRPAGLAGNTPPAIQSFSTVLEDPAGDASVDLLGLDAALDPGSVTFRVRMAEPLAATPIAGYLSLDLDRNPATGAFPGFGQGLPTQEIGAEVEVSFAASCSGFIDLYNRVNPHLIDRLTATVSGSELVFTLPYALLGAPDGRMHVAVVVFPGSCGGGGDSPGTLPPNGGLPNHDWMPETGHGIVGPCPWLTLEPSAGTLAPGDSLIVQLCVDATALADTALDCVVTIATNDPRTPERTLPVHVQVTHPSAAEDAPPAPPVRAYALLQNRPNPFRPVTRIGFALPREERVRIRIYDLAGRLVTTLLDATLPAGNHETEWRVSDAGHTPGFYFYRIEAGSYVATRKMLRLP